MICNQCNLEFDTTDYRQKYCTRECYRLSQLRRVVFTCLYCGTDVERVASSYKYHGYAGNNTKYCSRECFAKSKTNKVEATCPQCNKTYETIASKVRDGYRFCGETCRLTSLKQNKLTEDQLRDNVYFARLLKVYGLTREAWAALYAKHNGCCHICKQPETEIHMGRVRRLDVDHCHTTGKVRGLLCAKHNKLLGCAQDNVDTLKAAIAYLEDTCY